MRAAGQGVAAVALVLLISPVRAESSPTGNSFTKKTLSEYCLNPVLQWDVCGGCALCCIFAQVQRTDAISKDNCTGSRNHPPGFETRWSQVIRPRHPLGCTTDVFLRCLEGLHPVFETWRTAGPLGRALALSEGTSRVTGFENRASR